MLNYLVRTGVLCVFAIILLGASCDKVDYIPYKITAEIVNPHLRIAAQCRECCEFQGMYYEFSERQACVEYCRENVRILGAESEVNYVVEMCDEVIDDVRVGMYCTVFRGGQ